MQAEEGLNAGVARLGLDHAAAIRQKAIDHHAVEAGDTAHLVGHALEE